MARSMRTVGGPEGVVVGHMTIGLSRCLTMSTISKRQSFGRKHVAVRRRVSLLKTRLSEAVAKTIGSIKRSLIH